MRELHPFLELDAVKLWFGGRITSKKLILNGLLQAEQLGRVQNSCIVQLSYSEERVRLAASLNVEN